MYVSYIIIRIFFDTVSFVPKIQRGMMGSVCEEGINCNMSSFQFGDEVFTESSLQQTLVGKSENSLHKSERNNIFSETPLTSSEEI